MDSIRLAFNLTGKCNLSCSYCAIEDKKIKTSNIKPEVINKAYKKIRKLYPDSWLDLECIGNGEPLLNWEAIETIDNLKNKDKKVRCFVTTNGTLQEKVLELARRGWFISVSYDGIFNEVQRGKTLLVESTIKKLVENKAKFLVRTMITLEHLECLEGSLDLIRKLGVEYVMLCPVFPFGKYKNKKLTSFLDTDKLYKGVKHAEKIGLKPMLSIKEACSLATKGYYIMPNGKTSICYVEYIKPTKKNRNLALKEGCLLIPYKSLIKC